MDKKKLLIVTAPPHIKTAQSTSWIMFNVLVALLPNLVASCYFYGRRALFTMLVSVASAIVFEYVSRLFMGRMSSVADLSCVVTGVILACCLPVTVPVSVIIAGNFFAIVVIKQVFGGIGQNIVNPAAGAYVFLMVTFNGVMTDFIAPLLGFSQAVPSDAARISTSLAQLKAAGASSSNVFNLFLGNTAGYIGETSAALLLLGGVYLIIRKISDWRIPVTFIGTVAALSFIKSLSPVFVMCELFSGSLFLAAFFMACDPSTTPVSKKGKYIFGVICGVITCFIRFYGTYDEGAVFAVMIADLLVVVIDRLTLPSYTKRRSVK